MLFGIDERIALLVPLVMLVSWLLNVVFWHNWIHIGSLNVNYCFYALLVFHVAFIIGISQLIRATRKSILQKKQA